MSRKYDVITMGSGLVDAFFDTGAREENGRICFPGGEKIAVKDIVFSVGGGGANTATCFSHLGLKVGFLGKIGGGYNARIILRELKKRGIDYLGAHGNEHTGYSIILETDKKHRTILSFKGASNNLRFREVGLRKLNTEWFYFTSMNGESFKTQRRLFDFAKKKEIKVAFNPGGPQFEKGSGLKKLLRKTYLLTLNKEEAQRIVKKGDLFKGIHKLGPQIVSITNGENEGGVYDGNILYRYNPHDVLASECTGAGDVFGSSLVAGLIKFKDLGKAVRVAMANSESVIKKRGAQNGLLSWNQINRVIKRSRFRIKKEVL